MRGLIVVALCSTILTIVIQAAVLSPEEERHSLESIEEDLEIEEPEIEKSKHNKFFKQLTEMGIIVGTSLGLTIKNILNNHHVPDAKLVFIDLFTERDWIVRLSLKHEADTLIAAEGKTNNVRGSSTNPIDPIGVIPKSVYEKLLNGEVTSKFQTKFIKWVKKDLGYTDEDLRQFKVDQPRFCSDGVSGCLNITNIGGLCCPFG